MIISDLKNKKRVVHYYYHLQNIRSIETQPNWNPKLFKKKKNVLSISNHQWQIIFSNGLRILIFETQYPRHGRLSTLTSNLPHCHTPNNLCVYLS